MGQNRKSFIRYSSERTINLRKVISEKFKDDLIEYYLSKPMKVDDVCRKFDVSLPTFYKILKSRGVETYTKQSLYNQGVKEDFFEIIDSEVKAYFLGLLLADGFVYRNLRELEDTFLIGLMLSEKDFYMVERFKSEINIRRKIVVDKRDGSGCISLTSNKMASDLAKFGVTENKTEHAYLPILEDKNLMRHMIRGIIDGDGFINSYISNRRNELFRIGVCGTYATVKGLNDYLVDELDVFDRVVTKTENIYMVDWASRRDFESICNYLYDDATIYLKRKKDKFDEFKAKYL